MSNPKYKMTMSLNILNHLGLNLYSNVPSVLSEAVANSYDADAKNVTITILDNQIKIEDDGCGMSTKEINEKYLYVGYEKRKNGEGITPIFERPVMGRKGIGKLSLFSIANTIELYSYKNGVVSSLKMTKNDIRNQIKNNNGVYYPQEIPSLEINKGTTIIISDLKKDVNKTHSFLKKRLAKRFSIIGEKYNFRVKINGVPISIEDRDFFKKIEFMWLIGKEENIFSSKYDNIKKINNLDGKGDVEGEKFELSGWIGTVRLPSQLSESGTNNNKISIITRGKLAQEDLLDTYTEGGIYADYLIGEIRADFLDNDEDEDIATSSRQSINEDDSRFIAVRSLVYKHLKNIQSSWTELRNEKATEKIIQEFPAVKGWYDELPFEHHKSHARKLFKTIDKLHFDTDTYYEKKILVKQAILAFEQLQIRDSLDKIDKINSANELELVSVFSQLSEIEAMLYYDIASGRVKVIKELQEKIEKNELEAVLQKHIFSNLWLLNPSWERATSASPYMEKKVSSIFKNISNKLTDEEKKGRIDIGYKTAGGKHIIVELKRYKPSYLIDPFSLARQIDKYYNALKKCLLESDSNSTPYIETICIIGEHSKNHVRKNFDDQLVPYNGRIYPYDQLIKEAYTSYSEFLEKSDKVGRIKAFIDSI